MLAENVYGYRATTESVAMLDPLHRRANALALGSSLRTLALVCWPICLIGYASVGKHYAQHQRAAAYAKNLVAKEQNLEQLRAQLRTQNDLKAEMAQTQEELNVAKSLRQLLASKSG